MVTLTFRMLNLLLAESSTRNLKHSLRALLPIFLTFKVPISFKG